MAARRRARRRLNPRFVALSLAVVFLLAGGAVWLRFASTLPGQDVTVPAYVTRDYLTVNPWSRPGTELKKINGVVIHYVGNPGTTASGATSASGTSTKARSCSRGCGTSSPGSSTTDSP